MDEVPFNLPTLSGDVIVGFSKYENSESGYPHCYVVHLLPDTPQISLRAGSVASLTLGTRTVTPSANIPGSPGVNDIPAGALSYNVVKDNNVVSKLYIWADLNTSGNILWWLAMVGLGSGAAAKEVPFSTRITFTVTTSDVFNADNERILRGGTFSFPVQIALAPKDIPFTIGPVRCFREFFAGESVEEKMSMYYVNCNVHEPVGDSYGCGFPGSNIGGTIISPTGAGSGLKIEPYEETADDGTVYTAGVRLHGTAMRPGLYLAHVWCASNAIGARGSGSGGAPSSEFPSGDNNELIIISIRDKKPLPGDPLLLLPHDVNTVENTRFSVTYSEIDNTDGFADQIVAADPADVWRYNAGVWTEPPVWLYDGDDFMGWYNDWLNDVPGTAPAQNTDVQYAASGNTHLAGYWSLTHYVRNSSDVVIATFWYVIAHDNDGYWRLYCAANSNVVIPWTIKASTPELGLGGEVPPKCWPSVNLFAKGAEKYIVDDFGVFAYAGTVEIGDAPDAVTVEVFQQTPIETPQYSGGARDGVQYRNWSDLDFYPPKYRNNAGKLLYRHPQFGWVCIPAIDTEITSESVGDYQVSPISIMHVGIPFQPIAPPMVVGNNNLAVRRDPLFSDGVRGIGISNADGAGPWRTIDPVSEAGIKLVLMGDLAASGYFDGGIIWPHYPLPRMVNFERLRARVQATVKMDLLGGMVARDVSQGSQTWWDVTETYAYGVPDLPPSAAPGPGDPRGCRHAKSYAIHRHGSSAVGKCIATVDVEVPCWFNGYLLFGELRGIAAGMSGGPGDEAYDNSVEFEDGEQTDSAREGDQFWFDDGRAAWERRNSTGFSYDNYRYREVSWLGVKSGTLTADGCIVNVWFRCPVGFGREIGLCPTKVVNSDRPSEQIVFAGEMGIDATWHFAGSCDYQYTKYISWLDQRWENGEEDGNGEYREGHWYYNPQPADSPIESSSVEFTYSAGRSWATGLQVWNIGDDNILHATFNGEHRAYRQSGSYSLYKSQEIYRGAYSSGDCRYDSGIGSVSGRTAYDDIDVDDPTQEIRFPLEFYGGEASCRISRTSWDPNDDPPEIGSHNDEYHYPDDNTVTPTAAEAEAAYDEYRKLVETCDEDVPALPDYRADGEGRESGFSGTSSEDHRRDDIELTITIREW